MSSDSDPPNNDAGEGTHLNPLPEGERTKPSDDISFAELLAKTKDTFKRLGPAAPMAIAVAVLPPIGTSVLITIVSTTHFAATMRAHPYTALPIYTVAFWLLGICFLPTYVYSILGGWAFGFWPGFVAASLAYAGAMTISFILARRFAAKRVLPLIEEHPLLNAVRHAVVDASPIRASLLIALLRISPASPFAITNAVFGAAGVKWGPYLAGSALGVLPRTLVVVYVASKLETLSFNTSEGWWMLCVGIIATVIAVGVIGTLARRELDRQLKR